MDEQQNRIPLVAIIRDDGRVEPDAGYVISGDGCYDSDGSPIPGGWDADGEMYANELDSRDRVVNRDGHTIYQMGARNPIPDQRRIRYTIEFPDVETREEWFRRYWPHGRCNRMALHSGDVPGFYWTNAHRTDISVLVCTVTISETFTVKPRKARTS